MRHWPWVVWLLVVLASLLQISRTTVVTDVSAFLPGAANASQRLMLDQLRDGLSTRTLLIGLRLDGASTGVSGGQTAALVQASRTLRDRLAASPELVWVSNGDPEVLALERERLFAARYLLSPGIDAKLFSPGGMEQAFARLERELVSARGAAIMPIAANDPTLATLQLAAKAARQLAPGDSAGVWLGDGGRVALLLMETRARGNDIAALRDTVDMVRRNADEVVRQWPAGTAVPLVEFAGAAYFNLLAHDAIGQDAHQLALLALVLVALLLWWALRQPRFLALALIPVATGALAGFAIVGTVNNTIHGITLAFGVTLIGEAVDYAIYAFVQTDEHGQHPPRFWRQVMLATSTSLIGFAAMYLSGFAGLQQLGLFSVTGLLVAVGCTRWLLPPLFPRQGTTTQADRFGWLPALCQQMRRLRWTLGVLSLVGVALLAYRHDRLWQDSLDQLSSSSPQATARDQQFRSDVGVPDLRTMVAVQGANLEQALQRAEAATGVLDAMVANKLLTGYDSPGDLLPSQAQQKRRQDALPEAAPLRALVVQAVRGGNLKAEAFEPFVADVAASRAMAPLLPAYYAGTLLGAWLQSQIVTGPDGVTVLVLPRGAGAPAPLRNALAQSALAGVTLVDLKTDVEALVAQYRQRAMWAAVVGTAVIFIVLGLQLRRVRALLSMLASILSTIAITSAVLLLYQGQLSIFNLVSLLLVVGVASNYALFFSTLSPQPELRQRAAVSVLLAAASTFIGFFILGFSSTPVLATIGQTVSLGALVGLLASMVFSADAS